MEYVPLAEVDLLFIYINLQTPPGISFCVRHKKILCFSKEAEDLQF